MEAKTIEIGIGHQSMCTDTYSAGIVIKELKLLEKHLPHTGKYKDATYDIRWSDYSSGGPITNQMLANKLKIGVMGDYPLIVNGAKFQATNSLRTLYVAGTGYNLKGSGNGIVVPVTSNIYSIDELKGKVDLDAGRLGRLGHAAQGDAGRQDPDLRIQHEEPGAGGRRRQHRRQQDRRPRRFLPVVGNHGIPRHRPQDL